jgi:hypothetical protein
MRRFWVQAVLLATIAAPLASAAPGGYSFGGFSADGARYLKRGTEDRVCTVAERRAEKDAGFIKPGRSRKVGATTVDVAVEDGAVVLRAADKVLGRYRPAGGAAVSANANVFVTRDDAAVAVEYEGQGRVADVVVFPVAEVATATPSGPPPPAAPAPAPAPPSGRTNAYDRVVAKGGTWEQRMVPCDQAGVRLVLRKTKTFELRVETRCASQKDTTQLSGKWGTEGDDKLELTFENENGPTEALPCRIAACADEAGEDCVSCSDADVHILL